MSSRASRSGGRSRRQSPEFNKKFYSELEWAKSVKAKGLRITNSRRERLKGLVALSKGVADTLQLDIGDIRISVGSTAAHQELEEIKRLQAQFIEEDELALSDDERDQVDKIYSKLIVKIINYCKEVKLMGKSGGGIYLLYCLSPTYIDKPGLIARLESHKDAHKSAFHKDKVFIDVITHHYSKSNNEDRFIIASCLYGYLVQRLYEDSNSNCNISDKGQFIKIVEIVRQILHKIKKEHHSIHGITSVVNLICNNLDNDNAIAEIDRLIRDNEDFFQGILETNTAGPRLPPEPAPEPEPARSSRSRSRPRSRPRSRSSRPRSSRPRSSRSSSKSRRSRRSSQNAGGILDSFKKTIQAPGDKDDGTTMLDPSMGGGGYRHIKKSKRKTHKRRKSKRKSKRRKKSSRRR